MQWPWKNRSGRTLQTRSRLNSKRFFRRLLTGAPFCQAVTVAANEVHNEKMARGLQRKENAAEAARQEKAAGPKTCSQPSGPDHLCCSQERTLLELDHIVAKKLQQNDDVGKEAAPDAVGKGERKVAIRNLVTGKVSYKVAKTAVA